MHPNVQKWIRVTGARLADGFGPTQPDPTRAGALESADVAALPIELKMAIEPSPITLRIAVA